VRLDGEVLRISLPANFGVHKAALEKEELRNAVEAAVSKSLERDVRLEVACDGANGAPAAPETSVARKKALREQALSDPAVRKVLEAFDASVIDVEE
jgi:hypothetical protein